MTFASNHRNHPMHAPDGSHRRRSSRSGWLAALAALAGLSVLAAGCGGTSGPGAAGAGAGADRVVAAFLAYTRCMRSHGVTDFPDPTTSPGGGVSFQVHGGPGSDLDRSNPTFEAADHSCRSLLPAEPSGSTLSAQKRAAEVRWAECLRSHGVPSFPDPDSQGAIDSGKFDPASAAFATASKACEGVQPAGPVTAVPGH